MRKILLIFLFIPVVLQAQDTLRKDAIKIFLDGAVYDRQYIKENLVFVNYVRDHREADVYVLFVSERAGNGGERYSIIFDGQNRFKSMKDTLVFNTSADITGDELRKLQIKYLKIGLMPYVAKTPFVNSVDVDFDGASKKDEVVEDKWDSWVFETNLSGWGNGESSYQNYSLYSRLSADRVTPQWKYNLSFHYNFEQSIYVISDVYKVNSITREASFNALIVKSLGEHWSTGLISESGQSTYDNYDFYTNFMPAVEFDVFPYSKSTIMQLRVAYGVGFYYADYVDTTIYGKLNELLGKQNLRLAYKIRKKWGSVNVSVRAASYLNDLRRNSVYTNLSLNLRLFRGFSVMLSGSYGFVHDQINLPKGDLSLEEILTQQQQRATSFRYFGSFGISYTFGSIYNNVVNPRFD